MDNGPVVNELLCFVVNKMDTLSFDYIVKLCSDSYGDAEIECAKNVTQNLGSTDKRYPKRKGQNKKVANMQDILHILLELETTRIPVFVARDLNNLPPLSFEHFDISKLLHDLETVRNEVSLLKFNMFPLSNVKQPVLATGPADKVSTAAQVKAGDYGYKASGSPEPADDAKKTYRNYSYYNG